MVHGHECEAGGRPNAWVARGKQGATLCTYLSLLEFFLLGKFVMFLRL